MAMGPIDKHRLEVREQRVDQFVYERTRERAERAVAAAAPTLEAAAEEEGAAASARPVARGHRTEGWLENYDSAEEMRAIAECMNSGKS